VIFSEKYRKCDTSQAIFPALNNLQFQDFLRHKWYLCVNRFFFHSYQRSTNHLFQASDLMVCKEFIDKKINSTVKVENELIEQFK